MKYIVYPDIICMRVGYNYTKKDDGVCLRIYFTTD